jgi:hypothetical protein
MGRYSADIVGDKHDGYSSVQFPQKIEKTLLRVVINTCNGFIQQENHRFCYFEIVTVFKMTAVRTCIYRFTVLSVSFQATE